ncbi:T9SS type A sorting domain-containing protein, partial [Desulfosarcina sp.]|nr:T9SS type A sorting domain-containing protein [Desulfosarcina sp.]
NLSYAENVSLDGVTNANQLTGCFDLSNPITVMRNGVDGGVLEIAGGGTEIEICAGDGVSDAFDVTVTGVQPGPTAWVITDSDGIILGLPAGPPFDLEGAGEGICLIWHLSYEEGLEGAVVGNNAADLVGCYDLSNPITVTRNGVNGGDLAIEGGATEIEICAGDGVSDAFNVTLENNIGDNSLWVITDADANILATPDGPPFDLEGAGEGTCLIWHLSYDDSVSLDGVTNAGQLEGCYDLSNPITVTRNGVNGGDLAIEGGATEIEICAGDGVSDAFNVTLENNIGDNSLWVITDADANILATPDGPPFDLEGAGEGTCLIWHLSYDDSVSLDGVTNAGQLEGCYSLSNPITVTRIGVNGGALSRTDGIDEPFAFTVGDGVDDFIPVDAITLIENIGTNSQWVITDDAGVILGLPASPYDVNFEGAEAGTCLVWHLSFEDGLEGAAEGNNAANLVGCYSLSNPLSVVRTTNSGRIALYPNPAKDKVNLDLSNFISNNVSVRVFNLQNVQMLSRELNSRNISRTNSISINVSNYQRGIYFVNVTDNDSGKSYIKRLIVK